MIFLCFFSFPPNKAHDPNPQNLYTISKLVSYWRHALRLLLPIIYICVCVCVFVGVCICTFPLNIYNIIHGGSYCSWTCVTWWVSKRVWERTPQQINNAYIIMSSINNMETLDTVWALYLCMWFHLCLCCLLVHG